MSTPSSGDRAADENCATDAKTRTRGTQGARVSSREGLPGYLKTAYDTFARCINGKASPEDASDKVFYPVFIQAILKAVSTTREDERKVHEKEKENSPPQLTSDNIKDAVKDAVSEALNASPPSWAAVAARGAAVGSTPVPRSSPPPIAVPSRAHREVVIKGTTISDAVTR
ncbi:hypothetical protein E4U59_007552, partial [Claviceps monticola]